MTGSTLAFHSGEGAPPLFQDGLRPVGTQPVPASAMDSVASTQQWHQGPVAGDAVETPEPSVHWNPCPAAAGGPCYPGVGHVLSAVRPQFLLPENFYKVNAQVSKTG